MVVVLLLLLILYNTLVSVTELFAKDCKYDDLLPSTRLAVERAMGIIINNSGKFEHLVLMIAKRQTYRHRDRDINPIQKRNSQHVGLSRTDSQTRVSSEYKSL